MVVLGWGRNGEGAGAQPGLGAASLHQPCPRRCCASQPGWEKQPGPGGCLHHRKPLGKAPCAPWGFGCPARGDAHSSSLNTCGALQRGPEPAGPLAQPHCSPQSHLFLGLTAPLEKPPLPAGKPPAGRSGLCPALPAGGWSWESWHSSSHRPTGSARTSPHSPRPLPCTGHNSRGPGHTAAPVQGVDGLARRTAGSCPPAVHLLDVPAPLGLGRPVPQPPVARAMPPGTAGGPARNLLGLAGQVNRAAGPASRPSSERPRPVRPRRPAPARRASLRAMARRPP